MLVVVLPITTAVEEAGSRNMLGVEIVVVIQVKVVKVVVVDFDFGDLGQFHNLVVNYLYFAPFPFAVAIAATFIIPSTFVFVIAFNTVNFLIRVSFTFGFNQFLTN